MKDVCEAFNISRTSLNNHYEERVKGRKMGPKSILIKKEDNLVGYMMEMVRLAHPLNVNGLKMKVTKICQQLHTPSKDEILGRSWLKWFKHRYSHLVMRIPQRLDLNRAINLCLHQVQSFYNNIQALYNQIVYQSTNIWNVDESSANAIRNGVSKVFAPKEMRSVHTIIFNERKWISVQISINANGEIISNYYNFKGVRSIMDYLALCEHGTTFNMQKRGPIDAYHFSKWMDHFINILRGRRLLSIANRYLLVLDGHKAHITLEEVQKAKIHGIDMLTLPSYTFYDLQPLNIACFKPFKEAFRTYKKIWCMRNPRVKVKKEDIASWISLALKKTFTSNNIKAGFRRIGIWPINFKAMHLKMEPSESFLPRTAAEVAHQYEVEAEIMKEGLLSPPTNPTHFYIDNEEEEH